MSKIKQNSLKLNTSHKIHIEDKGDNGLSDYTKKKPIFSLIYVQSGYCIKDCEKGEKAEFATKIRNLSQFTWQELCQKDRHGLGYEKINQSSLKVTPPCYITEDTKFIAFRYAGKKAMVGYREGSTFHILWFDRKFNVYDHGS